MDSLSTLKQRCDQRSLDRDQLQAIQLAKLNTLLADIRGKNGLYAEKLSDAPEQLTSLDQLAQLPLTEKAELIPADGGRYSRNHTFGSRDYVRYHRTSGTHGQPLAVLDTADDWRWWIDCWQHVLDAAGISAGDRAFLAFSFGPFIGFWSAFDALVARGALAIPGGGMGAAARIDLIKTSGASHLFCTPSYALHLAEAAGELDIEVAKSAVETVVVAGEPGGSVPAIRQRIEQAWGATVIDHAGATEVGPWGYGDAAGQGLRIIETEFIAEFLSVETGQPAGEGELAELIITTLGRIGSPVIRYRTGDLVHPRWSQSGQTGSGEDRFVFLDGGVLGRVDDMMIIRGVNIFPSAVEQILRSFPEVAEYRMTASKRGEMDELVIDVEDHLSAPQRIATQLQVQLGLRIDVRLAPPMSLPRTEGKGRRFVDLRQGPTKESEQP